MSLLKKCWRKIRTASSSRRKHFGGNRWSSWSTLRIRHGAIWFAHMCCPEHFCFVDEAWLWLAVPIRTQISRSLTLEGVTLEISSEAKLSTTHPTLYAVLLYLMMTLSVETCLMFISSLTWSTTTLKNGGRYSDMQVRLKISPLWKHALAVRVTAQLWYCIPSDEMLLNKERA